MGERCETRRRTGLFVRLLVVTGRVSASGGEDNTAEREVENFTL